MDPGREYAKTYKQSNVIWEDHYSSYNNEMYSAWDDATWNLSETETLNLFTRLESSVQALNHIALTVQPKKEKLPDFTQETVMICWHLDPNELWTPAKCCPVYHQRMLWTIMVFLRRYFKTI